MPDLDTVRTPEFYVKFHSRTRPGFWECLEWRGSHARGYGTLVIDGRSHPAHRVAWTLYTGEQVPPGRFLDHLCCNKGCVNPHHLEPVTALENTRRILQPPPGWVSVGDPTIWGSRRKRLGVPKRSRRAA